MFNDREAHYAKIREDEPAACPEGSSVEFILQQEISKLIRRGYKVACQGENFAQMIKPKSLNILTGVLGYMVAKDRATYIHVAQDGTVTLSDTGK